MEKSRRRLLHGDSPGITSLNVSGDRRCQQTLFSLLKTNCDPAQACATGFASGVVPQQNSR